jgi:hypothetical protein
MYRQGNGEKVRIHFFDLEKKKQISLDNEKVARLMKEAIES